MISGDYENQRKDSTRENIELKLTSVAGFPLTSNTDLLEISIWFALMKKRSSTPKTCVQLKT